MSVRRFETQRTVRMPAASARNQARRSRPQGYACTPSVKCLRTPATGFGDAQETSEQPRASYAIGYGRPPTSSQFQPGQSGNPKGRPKGVRNASSMARDALERTINVKVKGSLAKNDGAQGGISPPCRKGGRR